jgi:hypothetical protein
VLATRAQVASDSATQSKKFAHYLREVFRPETDVATLKVASETLGRLVHAGGSLAADVVDMEVGAGLRRASGHTRLQGSLDLGAVQILF